ncbi:MAG: ABC transporter permease [Paludibaculum sp.]
MPLPTPGYLLRELLHRLTHLLRQDQHADELAEELRLHIDLRTRRNIERGMTPDVARREAHRSFGSIAQVHDDSRAVWLAVWLDQFLQDLRFGIRWLKRSPGFTTVIVLTLAIGIGINTAMFSVVNSVLLQPLPYPSPDRLVWIANQDPGCNPDCFNSRADYLIWSRDAHAFESMAAYGNIDLSLVREGRSLPARVAFVTDNFWSLAGAALQHGRLPLPGEPDTLLVSSGLFERQFGGDLSVLGRKLKVEGHTFEITGVLSRDFRFLFPQQLYTGDELKDIDAYTRIPDGYEVPGDPIRPGERRGPGPGWVRVFGKLKPDVSMEQARAELSGIHNRLNRQFPSLYRKKLLTVMPLAERIVGESRLALLILLGAVGFVLIIACANVANLLVARASVRRKEIAIRAALGAGQSRVLRQFLAESTLLALLGGVAGLVLARGALRAVIHWGAQAVPRLAETTIDARVLGFTLFVTLLTGILFGLAPAFTLWRGSLDEVLRDAARTTNSSRQQRLRTVLVSVEVALAVILLTGAGLLLRSFWRMNTYPPGFAPDRVLVMNLSLSGGKYNRNWPVQDAYLRELLQRIESVPGVEAAGLDCGALNQAVRVDTDGPPSTEPPPIAALRAVSPGYFRAVGVALTRGRFPAPHETFDAVLVNQSLAYRSSGAGGNILGKRITGSFLRGTIAGVVSDFRDRQLDAQPSPQVFIPYQLSPVIGTVRMIIRTSGNPKPLLPVLRNLAATIDEDVPIQRFQTLEEELFASIAPRRFNMYLLVAFAVTALVLALVGIYGVISYIVAQRTHEIGIRVALGARRQDIVGLVAVQGLRIILAGLFVGLLAAILLTRLMTSMIYEVSSTDPLTFTAVAATLGLTAFMACCRPAYRAALLDPLVALRDE